MKRSSPIPIRRRNRVVNPRIQGRAAVVIAAVVLAAGSLIALLLFRDLREALWDASISGHFLFPAPFRIVRDILVPFLIALFVLVFAGGSLAFLWCMRRIRNGISRLVETLEASARGDLSSPTDLADIPEFLDIGKMVDGVRSQTFALIGEARKEAEAIRTGSLPPEEFTVRWDTLKERIGRIAP